MNLLRLIVLSLLILAYSCQKDDSSPNSPIHPTVQHMLQTMPKLDREILGSYLQLLSSDHNFSYTLFGNKPISLADYPPQVTSWTLYHPCEFLIFEKGWEIWESYVDFFPSPEFVLKQCNSNRSNTIFLIHKKHTLQAIHNHLDTFQEILGDGMDPQMLLQQLCDPKQNIMEALDHNSALLGILLGYGKVNSLDFERKVALCQQINSKMTPPFSGHGDMKTLQPASRHLVKCYDNNFFSLPSRDIIEPEGSSLAEELNNILANGDAFELCGSHYFLDKIAPPIFVARKESSETKKLQESYLATKQKLHQVYMQGPFLELTLSQWMDPK